MKRLDQMGRSSGDALKANEKESIEQRERAPRMTQNVVSTLPKMIVSLCPECRNPIDAVVFEEDGKVFMRKRCAEHGEFLDLISSDARFYGKMGRWTYEDEEGLENPCVPDGPDCPNACGLCSRHLATGLTEEEVGASGDREAGHDGTRFARSRHPNSRRDSSLVVTMHSW